MMSLLGLSLPMSSKCNMKLTIKKKKALHLKIYINDNNEDVPIIKILKTFYIRTNFLECATIKIVKRGYLVKKFIKYGQ